MTKIILTTENDVLFCLTLFKKDIFSLFINFPELYNIL